MTDKEWVVEIITRRIIVLDWTVKVWPEWYPRVEDCKLELKLLLSLIEE